MYGIRFDWLIPVIVLSVLVAVLGLGIYQINSDRNPWDFGRNDNLNQELVLK